MHIRVGAILKITSVIVGCCDHSSLLWLLYSVLLLLRYSRFHSKLTSTFVPVSFCQINGADSGALAPLQSPTRDMLYYITQIHGCDIIA